MSLQCRAQRHPNIYWMANGKIFSNLVKNPLVALSCQVSVRAGIRTQLSWLSGQHYSLTPMLSGNQSSPKGICCMKHLHSCQTSKNSLHARKSGIISSFLVPCHWSTALYSAGDNYPCLTEETRTHNLPNGEDRVATWMAKWTQEFRLQIQCSLEAT